jgi:photosystem II stability/assembly factor-like uncharacterized protein
VSSSPRLECESSTGALFAASVEGIQVSRDDGESWSTADSIGREGRSPALASPDGFIIAQGNGRLIRSTDDGVSWNSLARDGSPLHVTSLALSADRKVFATTLDGEIFRSDDAGSSWKLLREPDWRYLGALVAHPNGTVFCGRDSTLWRSRDDGVTWTRGSNAGRRIEHLIVLRNGLLLAAEYPAALAVSTDGGDNWHAIDAGQIDSDIVSLSLDPSGSVYTATEQRIFRSVDDARSWTVIASMTPPRRFTSVAATSKGYLFAGTDQSGLYRTVDPMQGRTSPYGFALKPNYPNPFNAQTTIEFSLPQPGDVDLSIFNVLGQRVAQLVSGTVAGGYHIVNWNAGGCASGVYFCMLRMAGGAETKPMVLLK